MIPTCQQIFDGVRSALGDTAIASGTKYTDQLIRREAYAPAAYRELYSALQGQAIGKIERTTFYVLPAYTAYLLPRTAGIANFGDLVSVRQRQFDSDLAITGITLGANYVDLTVANHGRTSGQWVQVYGVQGISDDLNDSWMVVASNANTLRLNGCRATGTWTTNTGRVTYSTKGFGDVERVSRIKQYATPTSPHISSYAWKDDALRFIGAIEDTQLEIRYLLSGTLPTRNNDTLGIDDCANFMIYRTAGLLALQFAPRFSASLNSLAIGPAQDLSVEMGGFLSQLVTPQIRDKQKEAVHRPPYRPRRLRYGYSIILQEKEGRVFDDSFDDAFA